MIALISGLIDSVALFGFGLLLCVLFILFSCFDVCGFVVCGLV